MARRSLRPHRRSGRCRASGRGHSREAGERLLDYGYREFNNYAVAKAGLINLARYLAKEWAPQGIRVNCVAPGPIETPMVTGRFGPAERAALAANVPLGRIGEARHVAHAIDYLVAGDAAFVTGTVMNVSGGLVLD